MLCHLLYYVMCYLCFTPLTSIKKVVTMVVTMNEQREFIQSLERLRGDSNHGDFARGLGISRMTWWRLRAGRRLLNPRTHKIISSNIGNLDNYIILSHTPQDGRIARLFSWLRGFIRLTR